MKRTLFNGLALAGIFTVIIGFNHPATAQTAFRGLTPSFVPVGSILPAPCQTTPVPIASRPYRWSTAFLCAALAVPASNQHPCKRALFQGVHPCWFRAVSPVAMATPIAVDLRGHRTGHWWRPPAVVTNP